jgi:hypothetical protein
MLSLKHVCDQLTVIRAALKFIVADEARRLLWSGECKQEVLACLFLIRH